MGHKKPYIALFLILMGADDGCRYTSIDAMSIESKIDPQCLSDGICRKDMRCLNSKRQLEYRKQSCAKRYRGEIIEVTISMRETRELDMSQIAGPGTPDQVRNCFDSTDASHGYCCLIISGCAEAFSMAHNASGLSIQRDSSMRSALVKFKK
ncbi:MAG: hypothetical protein JNM40_23420 [Myxococcales bacterium]|nr:hypothetical protein [Myxococcales bacterium]